MTDVDLARKILDENTNLTLVVVKNGRTLAKKQSRGILPLRETMKELSLDANSASVADKVTGKASAVLLSLMKVDSLYTRVISKGALDVLGSNNINVKYDKIATHILNRKGLDLCPIEKLVMDLSQPSEILIKIDDFLSSLEK
jgi:hypothetical protein